MRPSFIPCLAIPASILPLFFTHAVAMEKYEPPRKSDAFWYMLGQNIDGAIVELDVNANYYGSGEIYPFLGGGLFLRKGHVHTGVRAGLNPILKWQPEVPQFYAGWVLGYEGYNLILGTYRVDALYGIEPETNTYLIEPRYTGNFPGGWTSGPKHRRDAVEWAVSYRYTFRDEQPSEAGSIMLHLLISRYGSTSPANYEN